MLTYQVIPFFLATILRHNETYNGPLYAFDVEINTQFNNHSETAHDAQEREASMLLEVKCRPLLLNKLKCSIEEVHNFFKPITDKTHNNTFKLPGIIHERVPFVITFNRNGVVDYRVDAQDEEGKAFMLELVQMFGDQLSINDKSEYKHEGLQFMEYETSFIGKCPTFYQVHQQLGIYGRSILILEQEFKMIDRKILKLNPNESLHINKLRYVNQCSPLHKRIMGKKLWPSFIPVQNVTDKIIDSHSLISLTLHSFTSMTENTFELYGKKKEIAGLIRETINVKMYDIEEAESDVVEFYKTENITFVKEKQNDNV